MNNIENGEEEDRFYLLLSFKIKLLRKHLLTYLPRVDISSKCECNGTSCTIFADYTLYCLSTFGKYSKST